MFYYRNAYLTAFPFFLLGNLIREQMKIRTVNANRMKPWLILGVVGGIALTVVEQSYNQSQRVYIGSILLTISLFLLCVLFEYKRENFTVRFGRESTLYLYVIHPMIGSILSLVLDESKVLFTITVVVLSSVIAWVISETKKRLSPISL